MSRRLAFALAVVLFGASSASAQVFGTFPWQMQPYCNRITLTLISTATGFTLEGVDDQCGATNQGSAIGTASFNASGNVTLSFSIVTAPSGKPVHVSAVVSPANGNGTWTDSNGNSGTFAFFGATPGLPARPSTVTFRASGHTAQAAAGSEIVAKWSSLDYNLGGGAYDAAAGTFTVPSPGKYLVTAQGRWTAFATAAGYKCLYVYTGGNRRASNCEAPSTTAGFQIQQLMTVLSLSAGDVVAIRALNFTGGAGTFGTCSTAECGFTVTQLQ